MIFFEIPLVLIVFFLLIGLMLLLPGCIICIQTYDGYRALISRVRHLSGPHPLGIFLIIIGLMPVIGGIIGLIKENL